MHGTPLLLLEILGVAIAAAGFVITLAVGWRIANAGGGAAVSELATANKVLEERIHQLRAEYQLKVDELGSEIRDLRVENAELRTRTDYKAVIDGHEIRAEERHAKTLTVLQLIATRLGPEPATV